MCKKVNVCHVSDDSKDQYYGDGVTRNTNYWFGTFVTFFMLVNFHFLLNFISVMFAFRILVGLGLSGFKVLEFVVIV